MARRDDHDAMLGAYALDAVDADERAEIEAYLAQTPEARAEVDRYQAAIVALAEDELHTTMPDGVWERVSSAMFGGGATDASMPTSISPVLPKLSALPNLAAEAGDVASILRPHPQARPRRRPRPAALFLAAAAAFIIATLTGLLIRQQGKLKDERALPATEQVRARAQRAIADPTSSIGTLAGDAAAPTVRAVEDKDGNGYLFADALPPLADGRTYQLWTLDGGKPVSLGILGGKPGVLAFPAGGRPKTLAITAEDLPGAQAPTQTPLVSGSVR